MKSAYDAEVVALAAARLMSDGAAIVSDCKAAIGAARETEHRSGVPHLFAMASATGEIRKVKTHAERRGEHHEWREDDAGNVKADKAAAGLCDSAGVPPRRLSIRDAITATMPLGRSREQDHLRP